MEIDPYFKNSIQKAEMSCRSRPWSSRGKEGETEFVQANCMEASHMVYAFRYFARNEFRLEVPDCTRDLNRYNRVLWVSVEIALNSHKLVSWRADLKIKKDNEFPLLNRILEIVLQENNSEDVTLEMLKFAANFPEVYHYPDR